MRCIINGVKRGWSAGWVFVTRHCTFCPETLDVISFRVQGSKRERKIYVYLTNALVRENESKEEMSWAKLLARQSTHERSTVPEKASEALSSNPPTLGWCRSSKWRNITHALSLSSTLLVFSVCFKAYKSKNPETFSIRKKKKKNLDFSPPKVQGTALTSQTSKTFASLSQISEFLRNFYVHVRKFEYFYNFWINIFFQL